MSQLPSQGHQWAIILAGGEGSRMQPFINLWQGRYRPKQYCTFVGTRSMLKHTIDRSTQLVSPDRVVTVIGSGHQDYIDAGEHLSIPGRLVEQPRSRQTAPGVFLPLTYIIAADPDATALIFPADHYIFSESAFIQATSELATMAEDYPGTLFLFGAQPDRPETDYGWIEPGGSLPESAGNRARQIKAFREKPSRQKALHYYQSGYLWNTLIMAVKARLLWELGGQLLPEMMNSFEKLRRALLRDSRSRHEEILLLRNIYETLQEANFSRTVLERATGQLAVVPLTDVHWSDWGRPHRVVESLERLGRRPRFDRQDLSLSQSAGS